ncbi:hypothetical protein [Mesorhizobium sp.]|uniref:hypothetical protein n=1 Tax=Mesorhizobium sp. TaxID=1871066 RepID=UPI000FE78C20|nr:hypothetical protein [Mesorhizobium sp.]RWE31182.1 MAG: hypothetical protein EOS77_17795 [Mesorhizobium sp.]
MNHGLAGTTGCANGNDGRYVRSQIHPAIMSSDCAEPASAYRESLSLPAHLQRQQDRPRGAAIRQARRSPGELAALGGNFTAFWNRHRSADQKIAEWRGTSVIAFAPTGRGVADFVQISLGREIEYLARSVVDSDYRLYSADDLFGPAWVRRELVTDAPVLAGPVYRLRGRLARGPASKQSSDRRNDLSLRPVSSARSGPRALMIVDFVSREDGFFADWDRSSASVEQFFAHLAFDGHRGRREVGPYSAAAQNARPEAAVGRRRFGAPLMEGPRRSMPRLACPSPGSFW